MIAVSRRAQPVGARGFTWLLHPLPPSRWRLAGPSGSALSVKRPAAVGIGVAGAIGLSRRSQDKAGSSGGSIMAKYLLHGSYTQEGMEGLPQVGIVPADLGMNDTQLGKGQGPSHGHEPTQNPGRQDPGRRV